ncbi:MAG TPA: glycoside hydrolase family 71 protein [Steroidobacteraceae bacterium]|nr:glycoside hydrolase family 71 protein [Steroidobacteraceae bacterium]
MKRRIPAMMSCLLMVAGIFSACESGASPPPQTASSIDACLPFSMPDAGALFGAPKKVFAHYFYPFPLSVGNKSASDDYYNAHYLNKDGERGKWTAMGGYLRQRPLPVGVNSDRNWQLSNMQQEVRMAIARGITGFAFDVLSPKEVTGGDTHLQLLLSAAQSVDPRFKIVVMPDISALKSDADTVVKIIAAVAPSPAAYRLDDGRLVVSAFNAGVNSADWWAGVFAQLKSRGISVAFVPTFLGWKGQAAAFAPISYGFGDWGTATANAAAAMKGDPDLAHKNYGKIYMMPVDPQQYRPKGSIYWEAGNSATFRNGWMSAINGNADWVQLVTWSDFSESSQIEPYTDATLRTDIGTGFYNLNAFYATWFLTGKQPTISHDVLYYFYRREASNAASAAQSAPNKIMNSAPEDNIELLAFLTAPGELKITIAGHSVTQNAPAGITSFKVPSSPGVPVFALSRAGAPVISFQGPIQIFGPGGLPSGVIDMTYWSGSASSSGVCTL